MWVAGGGGDGCQGVIERIDPETNQLQATIRLPSDVNPLAIGPDGVWFGTTGAVGRIDPATNTVVGQVTVLGTPFGEAIGFGSVWLTDPDNRAVYVVRPN